jgi:hypothetical protein
MIAKQILPILPGYELRAVAVAAEVHPRTVRRVMLGLTTKPIVRARIERVLRSKGISSPVPPAVDGSR